MNNPLTGLVALPGAPTEANQTKTAWQGKVGRLPWSKKDTAGKRIRLTHLDGKLPNLALMKLSAWFKTHGAIVTFSKSVSRELFEGHYDLVLGSSIFNWSVNAREIFSHNFPGAIIGGTGAEDPTSIDQFVSEEIEDTDYSIYPAFAHSIGFSQRGCRLNCSFCVVPKKEGIFVRGIKLLLDAGIKPGNIMVYFLCGYWPGETWQDVLYRFEIMKEMGLLPYPMVYDNKNKLLKKFQCWVIRRHHQFVPWKEYDLSKLGHRKESELQAQMFSE